MGPTWGPSGADRTQVGPMLAPWTLLSGMTKWTVWTTFHRPHFLIYFIEKKILFFKSNFTKFCCWLTISLHLIRQCFGANKQKAINWINVDKHSWWYVTWLGHKFSFEIMDLKMVSAKWWPFFLDFIELIYTLTQSCLINTVTEVVTWDRAPKGALVSQGE